MKTLTEKFIDGLRNNRKPDTFVYWNLFTLLEMTKPDFLKYIIDEYKKDNEDFFRVFHKSMRQCDFFGDDYMVVENRPLTEDEYERRKELIKERKEMRKNFGGETIEEQDKIYDVPEYIKSGKELGRLNLKQNRKHIVDSIGGHLDSIFYQTITSDNKGSLYEYMTSFFELELKSE